MDILYAAAILQRLTPTVQAKVHSAAFQGAEMDSEVKQALSLSTRASNGPY